MKLQPKNKKTWTLYMRFREYIYNVSYKVIVLVGSACEDEDVFYDCRPDDVILW